MAIFDRKVDDLHLHKPTDIFNFAPWQNVKDSNGNTLNDGDSVTLIKSLKVKGGGVTLKQGTLVKKIRLTDDDGEVDCKIDGMSIVLKTEF